jgi:hypothetical protein
MFLTPRRVRITFSGVVLWANFVGSANPDIRGFHVTPPLLISG